MSALVTKEVLVKTLVDSGGSRGLVVGSTGFSVLQGFL